MKFIINVDIDSIGKVNAWVDGEPTATSVSFPVEVDDNGRIQLDEDWDNPDTPLDIVTEVISRYFEEDYPLSIFEEELNRHRDAYHVRFLYTVYRISIENGADLKVLDTVKFEEAFIKYLKNQDIDKRIQNICDYARNNIMYFINRYSNWPGLQDQKK